MSAPIEDPQPGLLVTPGMRVLLEDGRFRFQTPRLYFVDWGLVRFSVVAETLQDAIADVRYIWPVL